MKTNDTLESSKDSSQKPKERFSVLFLLKTHFLKHNVKNFLFNTLTPRDQEQWHNSDSDSLP